MRSVFKKTFVWTCYTWNKCSVENVIFFWYYLNTTVCKFNNFNIGTENAIQNKFVKLHKIGWNIKSLFYFSVYLPAIQLSISTFEKSYYNISFSSTCFCYYRKHANNDVIRFVHSYLLLASNSTFLTHMFLLLLEEC